MPFLTSAVVATTALLATEADAARSALAAVASGDPAAALIVPLSTGPDGALPEVELADGHLTGSVRSVAGALEADLLLVPARAGDGEGVVLVLVDRTDADVTPVSSLDMARQLADVSFVSVAGEVASTDAETALREALLIGAALLASEQAGVARWCLEETVAYLKVRRQFGRVLGGFQALKHRLADLYAEVESAGAAARYAAAAVAAGEDVAVAARVAAAYGSNVTVRAVGEAVQLHGRIGMTWEHPTHLYLKRAKADQLALGTAGAHRAALADLVGLGLGTGS